MGQLQVPNEMASVELARDGHVADLATTLQTVKKQLITIFFL